MLMTLMLYVVRLARTHCRPRGMFETVGVADVKIDRGHDPAREVRVRVHAAVDHRDGHAAPGDAELRPGLRRADFDDPGRARFRAVERGIELRPELLVLDDI